MSFITPPQLHSIIEKVLALISSGSVQEPSMSFNIVSKEHLDDTNNYMIKDQSSAIALPVPLRFELVDDGSGMNVTFPVVTYRDSPYSLVQIAIGTFDRSNPDSLNSFLNQDQDIGECIGFSVAARGCDLYGLFGSSEPGFSKWSYIPVYSVLHGFLTEQGGSGESCSCKTWKGPQSEYDAITEKDPNTIYYITEA